MKHVLPSKFSWPLACCPSPLTHYSSCLSVCRSAAAPSQLGRRFSTGMERGCRSRLTAGWWLLQVLELQSKFKEIEGQVRPPPPHGLPSNTVARITTDCDAMRSLRTKWP